MSNYWFNKQELLQKAKNKNKTKTTKQKQQKKIHNGGK